MKVEDGAQSPSDTTQTFGIRDRACTAQPNGNGAARDHLRGCRRRGPDHSRGTHHGFESRIVPKVVATGRAGSVLICIQGIFFRSHATRPHGLIPRVTGADRATIHWARMRDDG